jgi:hypothetical protein
MKVIGSAALMILAPVLVQARKRARTPPDARILAVRKVYLTGRKRHQVAWARKHLGHFTCIQPVPNVDQADGILDLEPVAAPPPVEYAAAPTGVITCRSRSAGTTSSIACSDANGATEKIHSQTARDGESICTSTYFDPAGMENVLAAGAGAMERSAETHAYLLSKDGKEVLWDFDESLPENQSILHPSRDMWFKRLKVAAGCKRR